MPAAIHTGNYANKARELRLLKDQIAALEKEAKPLAALIREYTMRSGAKTDTGGYVAELGDLVVEARARTTVAYTLDKVKVALLDRPDLLAKCVRVATEVDPEAINAMYESGEIDGDTVRRMADVSTSLRQPKRGNAGSGAGLRQNQEAPAEKGRKSVKPIMYRTPVGKTIELRATGEASRRLGIGRARLHEMLKSGLLPTTPFRNKRGHRLFSGEQMDLFAYYLSRLRRTGRGRRYHPWFAKHVGQKRDALLREYGLKKPCAGWAGPAMSVRASRYAKKNKAGDDGTAPKRAARRHMG